MQDAQVPDYYELLQLSPRADRETVERVFRHLAKRHHPDNLESGDSGTFQRLAEAYRVLSDPEQRARYDARYQEVREARWRIFDQTTAADDVAADRRVRMAILSVLYAARRADVDQPGVGIVELERLLGCPEGHLKFHVWYLRENRWLERLDTGLLAITAAGVDRVTEGGGPTRATHLLEDGRPPSGGSARPGSGG